MVLGEGGLWGPKSHEGGALVNGISGPKKRCCGAPSPSPPCEGAVRRLSADNESAGALILDLPASETVGSQLLLLAGHPAVILLQQCKGMETLNGPVTADRRCVSSLT